MKEIETKELIEAYNQIISYLKELEQLKKAGENNAWKIRKRLQPS